MELQEMVMDQVSSYISLESSGGHDLPDMDKAEITQAILKDLIDARDSDDITFDLCEKHRLSWREAEALVRQVQDDDQETITLRQAPLLTVMALCTFFIGLVVLAYGIYQILVEGSALIHLTHIKSITISDPFYIPVDMIIQMGLEPFTTIIFGSALILGSLIGMRDLWAAILSKVNIGP